MNEEDPELANLQALAEKQDRQDGLASKPKTQTKQREVSVAFLELLGGEVIEDKIGDGKAKIVEIRFGSEEETQLIFRPETEVIFQRSKDRKVRHGRLNRLFSRWTVSLKGKTSRYDTQRELNKANRGLWEMGEGRDGEEGEPSIAFQAAKQLLACHVEIELQLRRTLLLFLLFRLHEKAEQEAVSPIKPEPAKGVLYIYAKPELETLREQLAVSSEQPEETEDQLNRVRYQLAKAHDAISLTIEALSKGHGGKVQKAFELLQRDKWPQDIDKLQEHAIRLAITLQRPPTKAELRKSYNSYREHSTGTPKEKDFSPLLKHAGLSWLKKERSKKKAQLPVR